MSRFFSWTSKKDEIPVKKPLLLVVEDSRKTQRVIHDRFTGLGCDVVLCETAESAWTLLHENKNIDVLILDFHLPGMNGPGLYERITLDKEISLIPVIPFTSTIDKSYNLKSPDPRDWARISRSYDGKDNATPIVSKGESEHIDFVPDPLIMNVARALRKRNVPLPRDLRKVVQELVRKIAQDDV